MGILKGSLAHRRYFVGTAPSREEIRAALHAHRVRELKRDEEHTIGWRGVGEAGLDDPFVAELCIFSMEVITWSIPNELVRRIVDGRVWDWKVAHKQARTPRELRGLIKDEVISELRQSALQKPKAVDVVWDVGRNSARFWSLAQNQNDAFVELFTRSFGVEIIPFSPEVVISGYDDRLVKEMCALEESDLLGSQNGYE